MQHRSAGFGLRFFASTGVLLVFASLGCSKPEEKKAPQEVRVTVATVQPETVPFLLKFVGQVESSNLVEVRTKVEGQIIDQVFTEGRKVKINDPLYRIDPKPFEAALATAQGEFEQARARRDNAVRSLDRIRPLVQTNAMSKRDLDNALAAVEASDANLRSGQARVDSARINLDDTVIRSPIDGVAGRAFARVGTIVRPNQGKEGILTTISPVGAVRVNFGVSEADYLRLRRLVKQGKATEPEGKVYRIELDLSDGAVHPHQGTIQFKDPSIDPRTGTMMVTGTVPDPDAELIPGQFVRVRVLGAGLPHSIVVPQAAVVQGQRGQSVYVVEDGRAKSLVVELGDWLDDRWIVTAGLKGGETIITSGTNRVQSGVPVVPETSVPASTQSPAVQ
jgi:membrane fusion protein (multidrug efflux system)